MRHANIEQNNKETGETILIVDKAEGRTIVVALQEFSQNHPRMKRVEKLVEEMLHLAVF